MASSNHPLGIDIGGSGVKGAPVDLSTGQFAEDRKRIPTPQPSTPEAVADVVVEIAKHFGGKSDAPVGVTVPAVVIRGQARTAANIDSSWIGTDAQKLLSERLGRRAVVVNDADAAGVGELHYGAARNVDGLVLLATLGTGIGSALLHRGVLIPNSELGHLEIDGADAETRAADSARDREDLSFEQWAARLQTYFATSRICSAGPDRDRRRRLQACRQVPAAAAPAGADRARPARQRSGHRRRRLAGSADVGSGVRRGQPRLAAVRR
jgi:polyphosphate glucokinase